MSAPGTARFRAVVVLAGASGLAVSLAPAALVSGAASGAEPVFTNTPLIAHWSPPPGISTSPIHNSTGDSEPAIAFGADGEMAVDGLAWLPFQVNLWKGKFGSTPGYFGAMDTDLRVHGHRTALGSGDADVDITSAGTTLLADLDFIVNPRFNNFQLGVSVTRCPAGVTSPAGCTTSFLDQAGADREWLTSVGSTVYVSYHDAANSTMIRVQKSTDDGRSWHMVRSPLTGQGDITGNSTFNNGIGPIVADPTTGDVYQIWAGGEQRTKCCSANYNNIYVARSTDGAKSWTVSQVFHAAPFTALNNIFPALTVDSTTGTVWTAWTDQHGVEVSSSTDHGETWSPARTVSTATTTVMPWVAARAGKVDVVYYASNAASPDVNTAVWNVYDSQRLGGSWQVLKVSNTPNRVGSVCLEGSACTGDRELLDLFEVAEDPITNKAAVAYTDSTLNTYTDPDGITHELPEIVLAFEH
jgi:hypothetical protein